MFANGLAEGGNPEKELSPGCHPMFVNGSPKGVIPAKILFPGCHTEASEETCIVYDQQQNTRFLASLGMTNKKDI
jgi:hypothetical protein